jgi:hypothetical protein
VLQELKVKAPTEAFTASTATGYAMTYPEVMESLNENNGQEI